MTDQLSDCTCFSVDPVTWTLTYGYDPSSYFDPDPFCPEHGKWKDNGGT